MDIKFLERRGRFGSLGIEGFNGVGFGGGR